MPYGYIMGSIFEHSINNLGIPEYLKTAVKTIRKICMEAEEASGNSKELAKQEETLLNNIKNEVVNGSDLNQ